MKLQALWVLGLLLAAGPSLAQMNNNQYHRNQQQIQNQNHIAEQHRQGYMTQQQQMQQQMQEQPPQPTGYWEKTWGAIAGDDPKGILGVTVGASDESQAERLAIADCKEKGGGACKVHLAYHNQCAVFVTGNNGHSATSAATIDEATAISMRDCEKADAGCRIYYSSCTEPVFHKY